MDPPAVIVVALILCAWAYCACLLPLVAGQDSPAPDMMIRYHVANEMADTDVGMRFDERFGEGRIEQLMSDATAAVWETFEINNYPENTNPFTDVYLTLKNVSNVPDADKFAGRIIPGTSEIELNSRFLSTLNKDKFEEYVLMLVYHEMTHVWQAPPKNQYWPLELTALREGTADYVALRAGHPPPRCHEVKWILVGESWRRGYCPMMYLLRYLTTLGRVDGIVAEINRRLIDHSYRERDFVDMLGSTPEELWWQYLDTLPADDLNNIGLLQVAGAGEAGLR